ncbi:DUF4142 domain-containing protein [Segnochrobactrum spirostomi]|uniref:DUF4142 domain-containing protein n=1 Tax=Segnochrobactrum spirostomi TaxID=2608987 RepID=A0A6A7Y4F4_9HYPH|nr:DUF4142 domain-containing protein [Segnochrobactrum spirostomi]MQT14023.1 DUF4142 domain-containing protein [Segnochrobactrum spirostomi]
MNKFAISAAALVLAGAVSTGAYADSMTGHAAMQHSGAAINLPAIPTPSTKDFVDTAAAANGFEIASSELALKKTHFPPVASFAKRMVHDHTAIGKAFVATLKKSGTGLTPPAGLGPDLDKVMARLNGEVGVTFERDYIAVQTKGHEAAYQLFSAYAKGGENAQFRAFAKKTLPIIEMHLKMCYALQKVKLS